MRHRTAGQRARQQIDIVRIENLRLERQLALLSGEKAKFEAELAIMRRQLLDEAYAKGLAQGIAEGAVMRMEKAGLARDAAIKEGEIYKAVLEKLTECFRVGKRGGKVWITRMESQYMAQKALEEGAKR